MQEESNTKIKKIGSNTIVDKIVNEIIDLIISGEYKAGVKLPNEFELIAQMGVSRNSLREAMKILSAMGIVEIKRGDGTYVCSQINPTLFDKAIYSIIYDMSPSGDLFELRQILDEATLKLAVNKATSSEIDIMQDNINNMSKAIENQDINMMKKYDMEFHERLIESCKNVFFIRIMKGVYSILEKSIEANVSNEKVDSLAAKYHQEMLDCIINKDNEKISESVSHSLKTWKNRV